MGWVAGLPSAFHFVMISPKPPHAFPRAVNFFVRLGELARHAHKKIAPGFAGGFVISIGFEPMTYSLEGCRSIQLSYETELDFRLCPPERSVRNGRGLLIVDCRWSSIQYPALST